MMTAVKVFLKALRLYMFVDDAKSVEIICNRIKSQEKPILVINDTMDGADEEQFLEYQKKIVIAFESIFPDKCSFEK